MSFAVIIGEQRADTVGCWAGCYLCNDPNCADQDRNACRESNPVPGSDYLCSRSRQTKGPSDCTKRALGAKNAGIPARLGARWQMTD
jgi:hypothetical protein